MMMMHATAALSSCSPQVGAGVAVNTVMNTRAVSQKPAALHQRVGFQRSQSRLRSLRAQPQPQPTETNDYIDYQGKSSVFPDEECEDTGENCNAEGVFKEGRPSASAASVSQASKQEGPDREYEEYSGAKTVFPGEACEDLGGEFCGPEFQDGVFPDKVSASKK